jgi:cyclase
MLKKRLIGVITVKNDWAVQSFGYSNYLPLGKPECLIENLDRWGVDEILIQVIDRSANNKGPDFNLIKRLGKLGLKTPLIYSGGIRSLSDGLNIIRLGADRIAVDFLLHKDLSVLKELSNKLGAQAIIASIPISIYKNKITWLNYITKTSETFPESVLSLLESKVISEAMLIDWSNEGAFKGFDYRLIDLFPLNNIPLILFGGISEKLQIKKLLNLTEVSAIAIGNFLSYKEHSVQSYKEALVNLSLRQAYYESKSNVTSN